MSWADSEKRLNAAVLGEFSEPIIYYPSQGQGDPIQVVCTLLRERITQSEAPGFFADIQVDPLVITAPERKDQVVWKDGEVYVVAQVVNPPYCMPTLALHRKFDPE